MQLRSEGALLERGDLARRSNCRVGGWSSHGAGRGGRRVRERRASPSTRPSTSTTRRPRSRWICSSPAGAGWRAENAFDLSWRDPPQSFAPIAGAAVPAVPQHPTGADPQTKAKAQAKCVLGSRSGLNLNAITDLKLPSPGLWDLKRLAGRTRRGASSRPARRKSTGSASTTPRRLASRSLVRTRRIPPACTYTPMTRCRAWRRARSRSDATARTRGNR